MSAGSVAEVTGDSHMKPIIGITLGDVAGIGPEIVVKALSSDKVWKSCEPWIYGPQNVLNHSSKMVDASLREILFGHSKRPHVLVRPVGKVPLSWIGSGRSKNEIARIAVDSVHAAFKDVQAGKIQAIVTAPVHKGSIVQAGIPFVGHTELLAEWAGVPDVVMMMASPRLRVALVTNHLPLRKVSGSITSEKILNVIKLFHLALIKMGFKKPRLAVVSLNPHGGEDGGKEEREVIRPAVASAKRRGLHVAGPISADALFHQAYEGLYDGVVAMYHDQALTALKMTAFDEAVNVTLGLPFIRTSPDHGTAFDIAGKGIAREESMIQAILMAARLCQL